MKFRTEIDPGSSGLDITHHSRIMLAGSCFSENIGKQLRHYRFDTLINPYGILFNPVSISTCINEILDDRVYGKDDLFEDRGFYHSLQHHGSFSDMNVENVISRINEHRQRAKTFLKSADLLVITFGSAWIYTFNETAQVVANCHKIPQNHFVKRMLDRDEIVSAWTPLLIRLAELNKNLRIVFTVSPVKYHRDGIIDSVASKSELISAAHRLVGDDQGRSYFPAYELVTEDLRDYRFYEADMVHPSEEAISYVWEKFTGWVMSPVTKDVLRKMDPLLRFLGHRPLHTSEADFEVMKKEKESEILSLVSSAYKK